MHFKINNPVLCIDPYYNPDLCISLEKGKTYTVANITRHGGIVLKEIPHAIFGFWPSRFKDPTINSAETILKKVINENP